MTKTLLEQAEALPEKDPPVPTKDLPIVETLLRELTPTILEAVSTIVKDSIDTIVTGNLQGEWKKMDEQGDNNGKLSFKEFLNSDFLKYTIVSIISMMCGQFISWLIHWVNTGSFQYEPFSNLLIDFGGYLIMMVLFKSILDRHNKDTKEKNSEIKGLEKSNATLTNNETIVIDKYERAIDHNKYIADVEQKQLLNALDVKNVMIEMMRLGFNPDLANKKLAEQYGESPITPDLPKEDPHASEPTE